MTVIEEILPPKNRVTVRGNRYRYAQLIIFFYKIQKM